MLYPTKDEKWFALAGREMQQNTYTVTMHACWLSEDLMPRGDTRQMLPQGLPQLAEGEDSDTSLLLPWMKMLRNATRPVRTYATLHTQRLMPQYDIQLATYGSCTRCGRWRTVRTRRG